MDQPCAGTLLRLSVSPEGQPVGEISWHDYGAEISTIIHAAYRGKGYGLEGLRILAALAFRHKEISCLCNHFEASRIPALRVHQKAGFEIAGEEDGLLTLRLSREQWLRGVSAP